MADVPTTPGMDDPTPAPADPGGANTKGYSAEPGPDPDVAAEGPLPLAPDRPGAVVQPERAGTTRPTGRTDPGPYNPNDQQLS